MKSILSLFLVLLSVSALGNEGRWSGVAEVNYFIETKTTYFIPIVAVENDSIYFEARYNYEDFNTASFFVGKRFALSDKFQFGLIPILGGAAGDTHGIVPGLEIEASYGKFSLYSQHEYLIDSRSSDENFYYSWSDLIYSVTDSIDVGISYQRFRPVEESTDVDAGGVVAYAWEEWWGAFYYYAVETEERFMILSLTRDF